MKKKLNLQCEAIVANILITGINGFVGSHLAVDQLSRGHRVIGIDTNPKSTFDVLDRCTIVHGDIRDQELIDDILCKYDISKVFHLAANAIVKIGMVNPVNNFDINVMGTVRILEGVRRINPKAKVVVASSDKAYGDHEEMPYIEGMKLNPGCPYSTSKSCTDMVSQSYAKSYDMDIVTIRCSNIYGPGDRNTSRLIPNSIRRVLRGEKPMIYSGVAQFRREFLYVSDVCNAYDLVGHKGKAGEVYNIGINEYVTIEDVVKQISSLMGVEGIDVVEKSFPEIKFQWMDGSKLKLLGWKHTVNFEDGLKECVDWYSKLFARQEDTTEYAKKAA